MQDISKVLFNLIKCEICSENYDEGIFSLMSEQECIALYSLAKKHDLAHFVGKVWKNKPQDEKIRHIQEKFQYEYNLAVMRYIKITHELENICQVFEDLKVPFIPLKGSVLRNYYPDPSMRTSCDIDILVKERDLEKVADILREKGYEVGNKTSHDIGVYSPNGTHLEMHYTLIENNMVGKADLLLNDIWSHTSNVEGYSFHKKITDEMFYYYHIAHMAKHFLHGGCGIRPFIDLFVLNDKAEIDRNKCKQLLEDGGLYDFSVYAEELSNAWLKNSEKSPITQEMEYYIFHGGVYGNTDNSVVVGQIKKGGKFKYAMSRIWLPYDSLKQFYPKLTGKKILLPFYEIKRWFRIVFKGRLKHSINELKTNNAVSEEKKQKVQDLLNNLGLSE